MADEGLSSDPRISRGLMIATYVAGGIGLAISFSTLQQRTPTLSVGCLLAVGVCGVLSFVRHAVFNRSDAVRMGWDYGRRNNFQIEVGLANLAWGLAAIAAVLFEWGLRAEAMTFIVFGFYLLGVTVMQVFAPEGEGRPLGPMIGLATFGILLTIVGAWGAAAV